MTTRDSLAVPGHGGEPVPNTFFVHEEGADHLAVLLPGLDYSAHMPALYYPGRHLLALGADVLRIEYAYGNRHDFAHLPPGDRMAWLFDDVQPLYTAAFARRPYRRVTLVGKSLGTLAAAGLLDRSTVPEARVVWLTPLLRNGPLCEAIARLDHRALFVAGTADPHFERSSLDRLVASTGGEALLIDGADHSLDIAGDVVGSIEALAAAMRAIAAFVG